MFRPIHWLAAAALLLAPATAPAGFLLDARYTGVVFGVDDTYGVFGPIAPGAAVGGVIQYSAPAQQGFAGPNFAFYDFAVAPGATQMTLGLGGLTLRATQSVLVQTYNFPAPDSIFGYDFQFNDASAAGLTTANLPAGSQLRFVSAYVGLFASDPSQLGFPNPPPSLLPLARYDAPFTGGFFSVDIYDATGGYVQTASVGFQVTGLATVATPAPAGVLVLAAGAAGLALARRRARRTV